MNTQSSRSVFVSIVTFNSIRFLSRCLEGLRPSTAEAAPLFAIHIVDNASTDGTRQFLAAQLDPAIEVTYNEINMGFAAAHNQSVFRFLRGQEPFLLILNPDVRLDGEAVQVMIAALDAKRDAGLATPRIMRADDDLLPVNPARLDAAGMVLTNSLRHLDRGSEELDQGQFAHDEFVFGGTGACLMLRRDAVERLILCGSRESDVDQVYPFLAEGRAQRNMLFDEAFFAFREDADLSWRAANLDLKCCYVPRARAWHRRSVLPERRELLPREINRWSVRNRFLLQLNNYSISRKPEAFISGILLRNLLVVAAVILREWSSLPAFVDVLRLWRRAVERRRLVFEGSAK